MHIKTANKTYPCRDYLSGEETVIFYLAEAVPEELGESVELYQDNGFVMAAHTVADWLRWEVRGTALVLTNLPVQESVVDVEALRAAKLAELYAAGNAAIVAGVDVTLPSIGKEEHFALHETDQINLTTALTAVEQGAAAGYPYHADGQLCRLYPAADILAISQAAIRHKLYHTTYCNHLLVWARRTETAEELEGITYGAELPEDLADNLAAVLAAAGGAV